MQWFKGHFLFVGCMSCAKNVIPGNNLKRINNFVKKFRVFPIKVFYMSPTTWTVVCSMLYCAMFKMYTCTTLQENETSGIHIQQMQQAPGHVRVQDLQELHETPSRFHVDHVGVVEPCRPTILHWCL